MKWVDGCSQSPPSPLKMWCGFVRRLCICFCTSAAIACFSTDSVKMKWNFEMQLRQGKIRYASSDSSTKGIAPCWNGWSQTKPSPYRNERLSGEMRKWVCRKKFTVKIQKQLHEQILSCKIKGMRSAFNNIVLHSVKNQSGCGTGANFGFEFITDGLNGAWAQIQRYQLFL